MLEAMNNSGELIIDVNELMARRNYIKGRWEMIEEGQEACEDEKERRKGKAKAERLTINLSFNYPLSQVWIAKIGSSCSDVCTISQWKGSSTMALRPRVSKDGL